MGQESQGAQQGHGQKGTENQGGQENPQDQKLDALEQSLARIEKAVASGQALSQSDDELLAALLAEAGGGDDDKEKGKQKVGGKQGIFAEGTDIDNLNNSQIADAILQAVRGELQGLEERMDKRFQKDSEVRFAKEVKDEIQQAKSTYGQEFVEHYEEVMKVAKRNPSLTVEEAFLLARARNYREAVTKKADDKGREASGRKVVSLPDGLTSEALKESMKGKSIIDTAVSLAEQIGFDD